MRGDVVFYSPETLIERIIARSTHGPFSHVAVMIDDDTVIEADTHGVIIAPLKSNTVSVSPSVAIGPLNVEPGIYWLKQQLGERYGWFDILDAFFRLAFRTSFYIGQPKSYDCSDLVTRYLIACGLGGWLGDLAAEPHLVTPNDLARKFKLI